MPVKYGYARVSTNDQNPQLQRRALLEAGCEPGHIFTDKASGKFSDRPALDRCLARLQQGDTLIVWKLDRFGRDTHDLTGKVKMLKERGVFFRSLTESIIDTTSAQGELIFQIFAAFAQFERSLLLERTAAGRETARAAGATFGRPVALSKTQKQAAVRLYKGGTRIDDIAESLGASRSSIYRTLRDALPTRFPRSKKRAAKAIPETKKGFITESSPTEMIASEKNPLVVAELEKQLEVSRWDAMYEAHGLRFFKGQTSEDLKNKPRVIQQKKATRYAN